MFKYHYRKITPEVKCKNQQNTIRRPVFLLYLKILHLKSPKTCLTAGFFVVRPSGFPLSGINLESAAHSKKTCLTAGFFVVRPSGFPLSGINLESAAHSKKTCLTAGFFVVRPSGFEPLAYRVGVCHSIQLSYGRIFSRKYYSKVRTKCKAGFSVPI